MAQDYEGSVSQLAGVSQVDAQEGADFTRAEVSTMKLEPSETDKPKRTRISSATVRKARDFVSEDVSTDEWEPNSFVTIKGLTGLERDEYELDMKRDKKGELKDKNVRARLIVRCAIDEMQNRIWSDEDANWLARKNGRTIDRLYAVAARLSGITKDDEADIEKN